MSSPQLTPRFGNLAAAYGWLDGQINYERDLGALAYSERTFELEAFRARLALLGEPQRGLRTLHVAGSRGKGSAAAALAALLRASGQRVALYTSPHLYEYRERIVIDGAPIDPTQFCRLLERVAAAGLGEGGSVIHAAPPARSEARFKTVFEHLTAMFLLAARESRVDWAVIETGLGGRLDATNAIDPGPVLLTRIGLEHTHLLGDTIGAIAAEKAAILKPGGWAVSGRQHPAGEAIEVFRRRAAECRTPLDFAEELCPLERLVAGPLGLRLRYRFEERPLNLALPVYGDFQAENLQNALAMLSRLRALGLVPLAPRRALCEALKSLHIPGRLERLAGARPELLVDGGHCPTAAAALARAMRAHFGDEPAGLLVGMVNDKLHDDFFRELAAWPGWRWVACYAPPSPRALPAAQLAAIARNHFADVRALDTIEEALQFLSASADTLPRVVATGSLYSLHRLLAWGRDHRGTIGSQTQATA